MRHPEPETTRAETVMAALLYLMTHYARTGCPKLAVCVSRHMQWLLPLHTGNIIGLPGRILVCLLGLAVAVLSVTGALIWRRKCRAAARREAAIVHA